MATTIRDIAELAGVSYGTVSRVLNNRPDVNEKTRKHVLKVVKEVGYQPNAIARSLVTKQSKTIAFVVPDISQPLFGSIALTVDREAFKKGYNTVLCNTGYDLEVERSKLQFLQEKRVDGMIIKPARENSTQFVDFDIPTILVSHLYDGETGYIDIENRAGGKMAGEHLLSCGYTRPCFIGGYEEAAATQLRLAGFQEALAAGGQGIQAPIIRFGSYTTQSGYGIMDAILADGQRPDAVFCGNDLIALGVLQRAAEAGLQVPAEIGVVGFDDVIMASLPQIRLTTIAQPAESMGALATDMLLKLISSGDEDHPVQKLTVGPELKVRGTTAPGRP